jgi:hypothetical protein
VIEGDHLEARAELHLTHEDVGLVPFTVALGCLRSATISRST